MAFAAALTLAVLLCITGILSYFHSEDAVSNRMTAISGSVMLAEPEWDSRGQFFPYNTILPGAYSTANPKNLYSALAKVLPEEDPRKYEPLHLAEDWETSGWQYSDLTGTPAGDGCFYFTGSLEQNQLTPMLLQRVKLSRTAYQTLTEDYTLRVDVLADAVQSTGSAAAAREWANAAS